ncbi:MULTISPECIES: TIM barrel protein [unclassified Roseitalea]|uniref:sugar phosphate isomerase/epimerase family protein n=1 Tax=unclassified Roseitalea TaxID=2639107 RepID=UPI00273E1F75|nr:MULTISPECIES: TIM barrel protein [unclassified Roseitalea]
MSGFPDRPRYAARLNAFRIGAERRWPGRNRITTLDLLERAAEADGLNAADLNFPDHLEDTGPAELRAAMDGLGIAVNGLAMRYYTDHGFKLGAFTHPDATVRQAAIDITRKGIDAAAEMGTRLMTLWMGQDGFDYAFQLDYRRAWDHTIAALDAVAAHDRSIDIAIEYKPNEPRAFALMPDVATTLLAIGEVGAPNMGVTLDFAHVLYADEMPAHSAALVARHSRLLGVHLNDGYGKRDDGLMAGAVHPVQTLELLVEVMRCGYDRAVYFDTFPDQSGLDPVAECRANIAAMDRLIPIARRLMDDGALAEAIARQDAPASQAIVQAALFGGAER